MSAEKAKVRYTRHGDGYYALTEDDSLPAVYVENRPYGTGRVSNRGYWFARHTARTGKITATGDTRKEAVELVHRQLMDGSAQG